MHEVLVNRLGGLSLPRKSVVRLTDRPDMTLDVYRGRKKTTTQQQKQPKIFWLADRHVAEGAWQWFPSILFWLFFSHRLPWNIQRDWRQQTQLKSTGGIRCKHLSGNNLPRIKLIRGKLFSDRYMYLLPMIAYWFQDSLLFSVALIVSG